MHTRKIEFNENFAWVLANFRLSFRNPWVFARLSFASNGKKKEPALTHSITSNLQVFPSTSIRSVKVINDEGHVENWNPMKVLWIQKPDHKHRCSQASKSDKRLNEPYGESLKKIMSSQLPVINRTICLRHARLLLVHWAKSGLSKQNLRAEFFLAFDLLSFC